MRTDPYKMSSIDSIAAVRVLTSKGAVMEAGRGVSIAICVDVILVVVCREQAVRPVLRESWGRFVWSLSRPF